MQGLGLFESSLPPGTREQTEELRKISWTTRRGDAVDIASQRALCDFVALRSAERRKRGELEDARSRRTATREHIRRKLVTLRVVAEGREKIPRGVDCVLLPEAAYA